MCNAYTRAKISNSRMVSSTDVFRINWIYSKNVNFLNIWNRIHKYSTSNLNKNQLNSYTNEQSEHKCKRYRTWKCRKIGGLLTNLSEKTIRKFIHLWTVSKGRERVEGRTMDELIFRIDSRTRCPKAYIDRSKSNGAERLPAHSEHTYQWLPN